MKSFTLFVGNIAVEVALEVAIAAAVEVVTTATELVEKVARAAVAPLLLLSPPPVSPRVPPLVLMP